MEWMYRWSPPAPSTDLWGSSSLGDCKLKLKIKVSRFFEKVFFTFYSHAAQNIMPPLIVEITPRNDNAPSVTLSTSLVLRNETSPPTQLFPNLTLSDEDDSPCSQQLLVAAQVVSETIASDSGTDQLTVGTVVESHDSHMTFI